MLVRYLETENFLSHHKEKVAFPADGIFLLQGESGAGKSSFIVDAVAYTLFGAVATRAKKQVDLRHHDHLSEGMSVRATFDMEDGSRLTIARGIDAKGASWAEAYEQEGEESRLLAEGATPVGQLIRKHIGGMTWQQFYAAFVARQSEISMLTSLRGSERKNLVQRMLGMRELEKGGDLIAALMRRLSAEIRQLELSVGEIDLLSEERDLAEEKQKAEESKKRLVGLEKDMAAAQKESASADKVLAPLKKRAEEAAKSAEQRQKASLAEQKLKMLEEKERDNKQAEAARKDLPEARQNLEKEEASRDELRDLFRRSKEHQSLSALLKEKDAELKTLASKADSLLLKDGELLALSESRAMAEAAEAMSGKMTKDAAETQKQIAKLRDSGECFICQRPFSSDHDHKEIISALEAQEKAQHQEAEKTAKKAAALREGEGLLERADALRAERTVARTRLEELAENGIEEDLDALEKRGAMQSKRLQEAKDKVSSLEKIENKFYPSLDEEMKKVKGEAALKAQTVAPPSPDDLGAAEAAAEEARSYLLSLQGQVPEAKRALEEAQRAYKAREQALQGRQKELKELQKLRKEWQRAEELQSLLRAYSQHLAHEIRPALEEIGSEMLRRVSGGRHSAMHIDDDYEISLEDASGNILKAGMISGGEAIRASICLRLALTRLVSQRTGVPVGFLMLDEPLPSQDEGHVERILELLQSLRPFYPQQFIISHVGELAAADEIDYILQFPDEGPVALFSA